MTTRNRHAKLQPYHKLLRKSMLIHKQNVLYNTDSGIPFPIITQYNKISTPSPPVVCYMWMAPVKLQLLTLCLSRVLTSVCPAAKPESCCVVLPNQKSVHVCHPVKLSTAGLNLCVVVLMGCVVAQVVCIAVPLSLSSIVWYQRTVTYCGWERN